nr:ScpA family protein [Propionibacterium cyclohexanicum]
MADPAGARDAPDASHSAFHVRLDNFDGPFDLLLQLIGRHKLDITELALSRVTDEFIEHLSALGKDWDLDRTSSFLVVAATLLDLKAARLLPRGEVEDPEDLALLEARDLLFARLLQYRAFKQISALFGEAMRREERVITIRRGLEEQFRGLVPEVTLPGGAQRLAVLAARALTPAEPEQMPVEQLHLATVNVQEQAQIIGARLRYAGTLTFRALTGGVDRMTVVARFLALLELFRRAAVAFEQLTPLGDLTIRWTGQADGSVEIGDEFDRPVNSPAPGDDSAHEEPQ